MNHVEKQRGRKGAADVLIFLLLLAGASAVTLILFYRQAMGEIPSDMKAYILEMQGLDSGYSFPYPVFFRLAALLHLAVSPEMAVALAAVLLNGLAMAVTRLALNRLVLPWWEDTLLIRALLSVLAVSLFFISMLYTPGGIYLPGIHFRYLGVFTPNPFHNATYMAARPFAILAFLWYVKLLPLYEQGITDGTKRDYALFSLFLFLATMTKPSFTLVMVSTCGILMLYRLLRSGLRHFVPALQLGLCFVPTFLALLYQYKGVFVPEGAEEGGVGFGFGEVWGQYCSLIPLAVCLAVGFPLAVLVLNYKECGKNTLFRFSWMLYAVGFAEAFLLYEKGFRKPDFNFSWGYMYGIFFCHFGALAVLLQATGREWRKCTGAQKGEPGARESVSGKTGTLPENRGILRGGRKIPLGDRRLSMGGRRILLGIQWAAYLCHVVCGIAYFLDYFGGSMYY